MIREEYLVMERTVPADEAAARGASRGLMSRYSSWLLVLGVVVLLAVLGLVSSGLVDSSGLRARVLEGLTNACTRSGGRYSLLSGPNGVSTASRSSVTACEKLVGLKPEDASARVLLGNAYTDAGRMNEAMACYRQALVLDPECFDAHLGIGKTYFDRGAYAEAIASYREALKIRPCSATAQLALGLALSNAGQYEEAMQAFQKAKELDPSIVENQVVTGKAYLQAGMCAQAIQCFKEAVQTDQRHAQAYFNLGRAYLRVGDKGLALEQQRVLESLDSRLADQLSQLINP